jgi:peptidoglycan/xylan/chitin deacetylase (PgdA/CDA1 family)
MSILSYHAVDDVPNLPIAVGPRRFEEHAAWLARNRRVLPLSEATARLNASGRLPSGLASITFDDGFASVLHHALPALLRHRLPATVFLVAGTLAPERREVDWIDRPYAGLRTLVLDEVLEMKALGVAFGSHSYSHSDLIALGDRECERDLLESRTLLEDLLEAPVPYLAYPRGRHDARVRRAAERAGYTAGFAMAVGGDGAGRFAIPRMGIYRHDTALTVRMKTSPSFVRVRTGRAYASARRIVGGA